MADAVLQRHSYPWENRRHPVRTTGRSYPWGLGNERMLVQSSDFEACGALVQSRRACRGAVRDSQYVIQFS